MDCKFCGKRISVVRTVVDREFCSAEHRAVYVRRRTETVLSRLEELPSISTPSLDELFPPPAPDAGSPVEAFPEITAALRETAFPEVSPSFGSDAGLSVSSESETSSSSGTENRKWEWWLERIPPVTAEFLSLLPQAKAPNGHSVAHRAVLQSLPKKKLNGSRRPGKLPIGGKSESGDQGLPVVSLSPEPASEAVRAEAYTVAPLSFPAPVACIWSPALSALNLKLGERVAPIGWALAASWGRTGFAQTGLEAAPQRQRDIQQGEAATASKESSAPLIPAFRALARKAVFWRRREFAETSLKSPAEGRGGTPAGAVALPGEAASLPAIPIVGTPLRKAALWGRREFTAVSPEVATEAACAVALNAASHDLLLFPVLPAQAAIRLSELRLPGVSLFGNTAIEVASLKKIDPIASPAVTLAFQSALRPGIQSGFLKPDSSLFLSIDSRLPEAVNRQTWDAPTELASFVPTPFSAVHKAAAPARMIPSLPAQQAPVSAVARAAAEPASRLQPPRVTVESLAESTSLVSPVAATPRGNSWTAPAELKLVERVQPLAMQAAAGAGVTLSSPIRPVAAVPLPCEPPGPAVPTAACPVRDSAALRLTDLGHPLLDSVERFRFVVNGPLNAVTAGLMAMSVSWEPQTPSPAVPVVDRASVPFGTLHHEINLPCLGEMAAQSSALGDSLIGALKAETLTSAVPPAAAAVAHPVSVPGSDHAVTPLLRLEFGVFEVKAPGASGPGFWQPVSLASPVPPSAIAAASSLAGEPSPLHGEVRLPRLADPLVPERSPGIVEMASLQVSLKNAFAGFDEETLPEWTVPPVAWSGLSQVELTGGAGASGAVADPATTRQFSLGSDPVVAPFDIRVALGDPAWKRNAVPSNLSADVTEIPLASGLPPGGQPNGATVYARALRMMALSAAGHVHADSALFLQSPATTGAVADAGWDPQALPFAERSILVGTSHLMSLLADSALNASSAVAWGLRPSFTLASDAVTGGAIPVNQGTNAVPAPVPAAVYPVVRGLANSPAPRTSWSFFGYAGALRASRLPLISCPAHETAYRQPKSTNVQSMILPDRNLTFVRLVGHQRVLAKAVSSERLEEIRISRDWMGSLVESVLNAFQSADNFWKAIPMWVQVNAVVIVLLAALGGVLHVGVIALRPVIAERAAIELEESFSSGLKAWEGATDWITSDAGYVTPHHLGVYKPSLRLTNYQMEFFTLIDSKGIGWAVRASGQDSYYALKLNVSGKKAPYQALVTRYAVVDGEKEDPVVPPYRAYIEPKMRQQVQMILDGENFSLWINGAAVDSWHDARFQKGGVGFFTDKGEKARVLGLRLTHNDDLIGKICAMLVPPAFGEPGKNGPSQTSIFRLYRAASAEMPPNVQLMVPQAQYQLMTPVAQ